MVRRGLGRDLDLEEHARGVTAPEAVALEPLRRLDELDPVRLRPLLQIGEVVAVAAKRKVVQLLAPALDHDAPILIVTEGPQRKRAGRGRDVEPEIRIKAPCLLKVGHREHEMIERMHADPTLIGRGHVAPNGGHVRILRLFTGGFETSRPCGL